MNGPKVNGRWPECPVCGTVLWVGLAKSAVYCDSSCRERAYRQRRALSKLGAKVAPESTDGVSVALRGSTGV